MTTAPQMAVKPPIKETGKGATDIHQAPKIIEKRATMVDRITNPDLLRSKANGPDKTTRTKKIDTSRARDSIPLLYCI